MHITGASGKNASEPNPDYNPMLAIPAMGSNPASWLAASFIDPNLNKPLHLQLVDEGFDTWMLYSRGSPYSRVHKEYSELSKDFWSFSWEEMGRGDIKVAVDFVHSFTGKQVSLSGYSMGTT